jgi:hypothetical protein
MRWFSISSWSFCFHLVFIWQLLRRHFTILNRSLTTSLPSFIDSFTIMSSLLLCHAFTPFPLTALEWSIIEGRENINKKVDVTGKFVLIIFFEKPSDKQLTIRPDEGSNDRH